MMFWFCLRRRLRVACSHRGSDCAYGAARIVVQLPSRVVRRRARLRHSTANHRRCGFKLTACSTCCGWRMLSTAALSRRVLRGGDSIRPGTARWTLSRSPSAAPTRRSRRTPPGGGDSAFLLHPRLLRRVRCQRPLRLGLRMRRARILVQPSNRTARRCAHLRHSRLAIGDAASSPATWATYGGRRRRRARRLTAADPSAAERRRRRGWRRGRGWPASDAWSTAEVTERSAAEHGAASRQLFCQLIGTVGTTVP